MIPGFIDKTGLDLPNDVFLKDDGEDILILSINIDKERYQSILRGLPLSYRERVIGWRRMPVLHRFVENVSHPALVMRQGAAGD
jgi:hypothetical protein